MDHEKAIEAAARGESVFVVLPSIEIASVCEMRDDHWRVEFIATPHRPYRLIEADAKAMCRALAEEIDNAKG